MKPPSLAKMMADGNDTAEEATEPDGDEEMDTDGAKHDAAQALIDSLAAKDAAGVSAALSTHYDLCAHKGEE